MLKNRRLVNSVAVILLNWIGSVSLVFFLFTLMELLLESMKMTLIIR
jgi:hypothetical protein